MEPAGQKLRRVRERMNLRYRDVEEASGRIAERHHNDEFIIALSRLADIENKGTVPSIFRLYSLSTIYRLDILEVLRWYGVDANALPADALSLNLASTHLAAFNAGIAPDVQFPAALDPGIDLRRTTFLSRMIQRWGRLPMALLNTLDLKDHRYGFIGTEDWFMYPLLQPGSLVLIDETKRKIINSGWNNEFDRPIYFLEHRDGYACGWCSLHEKTLLLQPHAASMCAPRIHAFPEEIDVVGQVTAVAMHLDQGKRRHTRS